MRRWIICLLLALPLSLLTAPVPPRAAPRAAPGPSLDDDNATLPDADEMARLAAADPVAFLEVCLKRHSRQPRSYHGTLLKQETIGGVTHPPEEIEFYFRERPHAVLMLWRTGYRSVLRSLYVVDENRNQIVGLPNRPLMSRMGILWHEEVDSPRAREVSRYTMAEFGFEKPLERTWRAWKAARARGELFTEYRGIEARPDLDNRPCHVLRRRCDPPAEEGMTDLEVCIDAEYWIQLGSKLTGPGGRLIGDYRYVNLTFDPPIPPDTFTPAALRK